MVAVKGDQIVLLRPMAVLTKEQALQLAAWLVALSDKEDEFPALLDAVLNT